MTWVLNGEKAWITNAGVGSPGRTSSSLETDPNAGKARHQRLHRPGRRARPRASVRRRRRWGCARRARRRCAFQGLSRIRRPIICSGRRGRRLQASRWRLSITRASASPRRRSASINGRWSSPSTTPAISACSSGVPIAKHQAIRFTIAEIATELAASRTLLYGACRRDAEHHRTMPVGWPRRRSSTPPRPLTAPATRRYRYTAATVSTEEAEIARLYRDVRVTTIYEGTSEMQRLVIARHLLR